MRRIWTIGLLVALAMLGKAYTPALAQESQQRNAPLKLTLSTHYPDQMAQVGETVTFDLTVRAPDPQVVHLEMREVPAGWTPTFTGEGRVIESVYVEPDHDGSASLKLEPPKDVAPGSYRFVVVARGNGTETELPIGLTIKDKLPSKLAFDAELPTLKGTPTTTFRYNTTLKNEGDEPLTINLAADAPQGFQVNFSLSGQDVTSFPLNANETKRLTVEVVPPPQTPAGQYQVTVSANGSEAQQQLVLTAEVTGQPDLSVTTPDERLSGQAYAGRVTPFKVVVRNSGSAAARDVKLSASPPSGWSISFQPEQITEIPPGQQVEATANVHPAEQAIAGDYMVTVRAQPGEGASKSMDLRITVLTSTLWGVVGLALIAIAVGAVGVAVVRFGRR
ncbi:MAG: NEW3 domain-containing protein [Ardenticatenaceae bacterium]|nr:NEW3 domain-containing protein [Ardenticatenaceae bacterium]